MRLYLSPTAWRFEILTPAKVPALKALHHSVQLVAEAAAQARESGWLQVAHELLSGAPAGKPFVLAFVTLSLRNALLLLLRFLCKMPAKRTVVRLAAAAASAPHILPQSRLRQPMNARGSQQTMPPTGPLAWHLIFNRRGPFSQMLRQQLTDLGVLQSTCGSIMQTSHAQAAAVIPQLLAVAALARDTPDNAQFFIQQGARPSLAAIITPMTLNGTQEHCLQSSSLQPSHLLPPFKKRFPAQYCP